MRDEFLKEENQNFKNNMDKCKCPRIVIEIAGIKVNALIDTGSEITCISKNFFDRNEEILKRYPIIPIVGHAVRGAATKNYIPLKIQVMVITKISAELVDYIIFIVVPELNEDCILGYDTMRNYKVNIDCDREVIRFKIPDSYAEEQGAGKCETHKIQIYYSKIYVRGI